MNYFNTVITMLILCILTQILWYAVVILEEGISIVVQSEKERKSSKARGLPLKTFFKHHSLYGFRFKDFDRSLFLSLSFPVVPFLSKDRGMRSVFPSSSLQDEDETTVL